jgi:hypothetical protein
MQYRILSCFIRDAIRLGDVVHVVDKVFQLPALYHRKAHSIARFLTLNTKVWSFLAFFITINPSINS